MPASLAADALGSTVLRCHHCSRVLGECMEPLTLVGLVKEQDLLTAIPRPRDVRRCRGCGWFNVFKPPGS